LQDLTDNERDVDGWVVKRSNFHVKKFGNAVLYCGRTFKFHAKTEQFKTTPVGKIVDVVQKKAVVTQIYILDTTIMICIVNQSQTCGNMKNVLC
jgi:hypothetical protein